MKLVPYILYTTLYIKISRLSAVFPSDASAAFWPSIVGAGIAEPWLGKHT